MNIAQGLKVDNPDVFVPWNIPEDKLEELLGKYGLRHITRGYYAISCETLGGLKHELGFHFEPRENGQLKELEFFRKIYESQIVSYNEFQQYFEKEFGLPTKTMSGIKGFASHEWILDRIKIIHCVDERFTLEEHMRIIKI
jgi:hypothetical protein